MLGAVAKHSSKRQSKTNLVHDAQRQPAFPRAVLPAACLCQRSKACLVEIARAGAELSIDHLNAKPMVNVCRCRSLQALIGQLLGCSMCRRPVQWRSVGNVSGPTVNSWVTTWLPSWNQLDRGICSLLVSLLQAAAFSSILVPSCHSSATIGFKTAALSTSRGASMEPQFGVFAPERVPNPELVHLFYCFCLSFRAPPESLNRRTPHRCPRDPIPFVGVSRP